VARVELEGRNWKKLEAALAERKHARLFEDRADVKLVGDDAVTYGDFSHMLAIAGKVGFAAWRVIEPSRDRAGSL
jgi:biopolymer transport protein ExbD